MTPLQRIKALNEIIHDHAKGSENPPGNAPESLKAIWGEINLTARCAIIECCEYAAEKEEK